MRHTYLNGADKGNYVTASVEISITRQARDVGTTATSDDGKATYKITTSDLTNGTVTYVAPTDKKKTTVTKKIGSKAFSKTPKSMTVKVPKKKFKAYKSMLIKKGVSKTAKFKKS